MTIQDWIAAAIALLAFYWLLRRFGITGWVSKSLLGMTSAKSSASSSGGCAKCGDE